MNTDQFWVFALTGLILNFTPGNDMLYIIARSSGQGIRAGIISALGIGAGCLVHILAAVIGLSALIAKSALGFEIIKFAGAAYLIYLGVKSILSKKNELIRTENQTAHTNQNIFWQGVLTNVLNPKVALFFLAFLPQFIQVEKGHASMQILFLGIWFDLVGTIVNILVAILFGKIGSWLSKSPGFIKWQQRITGFILVALGIRLAMGTKQ